MFYGISMEEYLSMLAKQENRCQICTREFGEDLIPHIDHDHDSGWVRGILCQKCNQGLGVFDENPDCLEAAARYVVKNSPPTEFNISSARSKLSRKWNQTRVLRELRHSFKKGSIPWNAGQKCPTISAKLKARWNNVSPEDRKRWSDKALASNRSKMLMQGLNWKSPKRGY